MLLRKDFYSGWVFCSCGSCPRSPSWVSLSARVILGMVNLLWHFCCVGADAVLWICSCLEETTTYREARTAFLLSLLTLLSLWLSDKPKWNIYLWPEGLEAKEPPPKEMETERHWNFNVINLKNKQDRLEKASALVHQSLRVISFFLR